MSLVFKSLALVGAFLFICQPPNDKNNIDWIFVKGGSFEQGKNQFIVTPQGDSIFGWTSPHRMIELNDFYISKYEITVGQFKEFIKSTDGQMPDAPIESAHGKKVYHQWIDNQPMLATWKEARDYAQWAGGRLPTEAEWEYAAKGGQQSKGYIYSGSNDATEIGWVGENSDSIFHPVGQLKPNELGIFDMTGNVSEWVNDWYFPEKDSLLDTINPKGPSEGEMKISKGVSWFYNSYDHDGKPLKFGIHMPEVRYQSPIDTRNDGFGFRIAKDK